jgi:hypothetical protein
MVVLVLIRWTETVGAGHRLFKVRTSSLHQLLFCGSRSNGLKMTHTIEIGGGSSGGSCVRVRQQCVRTALRGNSMTALSTTDEWREKNPELVRNNWGEEFDVLTSYLLS